MKVIINNTTYEMSREAYQKILDTASKFVSFGIYAVEKSDFAELKNNMCKSIPELREMVSEYKKKGFKVYYNK